MSRNKNNTPAPVKPNYITDVFNIALAEVKVPVINPTQVRYSAHEWVFYGDNNLFPDFLMKSIKKSINHSGFIALRENMIKGGGLAYSDNIKEFLENLDGEENTIEELLEDWATDLSILETFACAVRYNKTKDKIICIDYIDSSKVRPAKIVLTPEEVEEGVTPTIKGYWVSADWSNISLNPPRYYEKFNPNNINDTTQLFFYYKRANGQPYIPEISYASCLNYVEAEYHTGKWIHNTMLNGFNPSAILEVSGVMDEERKGKFRQEIRNNFQGADSAGNIMVVGSEFGESVKVNPINTGDNTPLLEAISALTLAAISTAHKCQPVVAGIQPVGSTLGSDGKLLKASQEAFYNNVIVHLQKPILSFLKKVFKFNKITDYQLTILSSKAPSEDIPDWFLQDFIKPEVLAAKYGFKAEDLIQNPITPNAEAA